MSPHDQRSLEQPAFCITYHLHEVLWLCIVSHECEHSMAWHGVEAYAEQLCLQQLIANAISA